MLLARYVVLFILSLFLCSAQGFAMGSIMDNSSTQETHKPFSFEDYEVDNKNIEPMKQDLLKRFPIGSNYAPLREELLKAGASVKATHPEVIKRSSFHKNTETFKKEYYKIFWSNISWMIIINTDGNVIKEYYIITGGLTFK